MTLSVDIRTDIGGFLLEAAFQSDGRVTALFGPSGAGKTTILNLIAGLARPTGGSIALDSDRFVDTSQRLWVPAHKRQIGYIFQESRLFPHLSVRRNLNYGRRHSRPTAAWADFDNIVAMLGIGHLLDRRPAGLSGGERQRVAIGRALLASPRLLLMDEPLASLDEARKAELLPYLEQLRDRIQLPIVYVSHTIGEIARLADTMVLISNGNVAAAGDVGAMLSRTDLRHLIGHEEASVTLRLPIAGHGISGDATVLQHPAGPLTVPFIDRTVGDLVRLRIRARDVALALGEPGQLSIRNRLPAKITGIEKTTGPLVEVQLQSAGMPLLAMLTRDAVAALGLRDGQEVTALIKATAFDRLSLGMHEDSVKKDPHSG